MIETGEFNKELESSNQNSYEDLISNLYGEESITKLLKLKLNLTPTFNKIPSPNNLDKLINDKLKDSELYCLNSLCQKLFIDPNCDYVPFDYNLVYLLITGISSKSISGIMVLIRSGDETGSCDIQLKEDCFPKDTAIDIKKSTGEVVFKQSSDIKWIMKPITFNEFSRVYNISKFIVDSSIGNN